MALPFRRSAWCAAQGHQQPCFACFVLLLLYASVQPWLLAPRRLHFFMFGGFMSFLQEETRPVWPQLMSMGWKREEEDVGAAVASTSMTRWLALGHLAAQCAANQDAVFPEA